MAFVASRGSVGADDAGQNGLSRRRFLGWAIAGPTIIAGAQLATDTAAAAVPTHQLVDNYDLSDLLNQAAAPTSGLITITVNRDGSVSFALPRAEVGQGITTAVAMVIADEMDVPLNKVKITLADARPELNWNQFTGGSNTMHSIYTPVRVAAAIARGQLLQAAADLLGGAPSQYGISGGVVTAPGGRRATFGELARHGAVSRTRAVRPTLKAASAQKLVGSPTGRIDAHDIVVGRKQFAMDLQVRNALPTMVCRPPTINGVALAVRNAAQVKADHPEVTDIVIVPHTANVPGGVAVRARTFGTCIDAIRELDVAWGPGSAEGKSDESVAVDLKAAELPLTPALPLGTTIEKSFTFYFRPGDPLETNCAIADVRANSAEIWSALKSPIWAQEQLAVNLGIPLTNVKVHVTQGGGSFGRHLFADAAFEAAAISKAIGKPVKLMWHRTDNFRQGRVHPMATSRVRATYLSGQVLSFDQRHTSVATDFSMGFGELLSANFATLPMANSLGYSQAVFNLTQNVPYNFGVVDQLINEVYAYNTLNTGSVRNIYSPNVTTAIELMVDQLAAALRQDAVQFRRSFLRNQRLADLLATVVKEGHWGKPMAPLTAQGVGIHAEYKSACACLVEIDCTPHTVNRPLPDNIPGITGPRVTKAVIAVDVGLPVNPRGLEAQMLGGLNDAIAQVLTYSLHLKDGHYLEGSWDNAFYTRQWNTPLDVKVFVSGPTTGQPGGAGELALAPAMAAVACAYARATGTVPTRFPINHNAPLPFDVLPTVPSIPPSPTDGLSKAY